MGFDPVAGVGTGCWPCMKRLSGYLFDRFGGWDLGCYNPASRAGGGPSLHAEGRAQDFAFNANDPDERAAGDALFEWAVAHADEIGLQEILWRGLIWYWPRRGEGVRDGVQQADHMSHVHLGVDKNAGMNWDPSWVTESTPTKRGRMNPGLFVDANGAVWVYDPNTKTKAWVTNPDELSAVQALRTLSGLPADIIRNSTTDALLAGAIEIKKRDGSGGTIDLSGFTISGTFTGAATP